MDRPYKPPTTVIGQVIYMVDLTTRTIRNLFEKQVRDLTERTLITKEDSFDYQMSGGWF